MSSRTSNDGGQVSPSVSIIEPVGGHSGAHYYDFGLCRGLIAAGCKASLYTCDETADPHIPGLPFYPVYRNIFGKGSRWLRGLRYLRGTVATLRQGSASHETICHYQVFNDLIPELIVIGLAKIFRRKIVLTVHDVDSLAGSTAWKRTYTGRLYNCADQIIVHNTVSMKELEELGGPSSKINIIAHGHYFDSMQPLPEAADARRALDIGVTDKVVLFFGQIKDVKGLDILIEAMAIVAREAPDAVLLIAGRPWKTDFSKYDKLIDAAGIRERCRLRIGYIPDDEVAKYYAAADLVVLPYRRIYQSGVLVMAMTYGRPVVVSDLPGMTEVITDGANGYVFASGSKEALADTVIRALSDESTRQQIAQRGSEYIRQHHDWSDIGRRTAELFRATLTAR